MKKKKLSRRRRTDAQKSKALSTSKIAPKEVFRAEQAGRLRSRTEWFIGLLASENIASPPPGRARAIASTAIILYLLWQILVPLSYYIGDAKADERFAWRMFSALRQAQKTCKVEAIEWLPAGRSWRHREVDIERTVHPSWIGLLERNRSAVVEKFLSTRCAVDPSVNEIQFVRRCSNEDGLRSRFDDLVLNCQTGILTKVRATP